MRRLILFLVLVFGAKEVSSQTFSDAKKDFQTSKFDFNKFKDRKQVSFLYDKSNTIIQTNSVAKNIAGVSLLNLGDNILNTSRNENDLMSSAVGSLAVVLGSLLNMNATHLNIMAEKNRNNAYALKQSLNAF